MPRNDHGTHTEHDAGRFERAHIEPEDDRPWHEQYEPGDEL